MMMVKFGFSNPILGHAFSSIRAVSPSETITQRLNSLESRLLLKTTEENIEDSVSIFDFSSLIHPSPFKTTTKKSSSPPVARLNMTRTNRRMAPKEQRKSVEKKSLEYKRSVEKKRSVDDQSRSLKSFSSFKSMGSEKTPKQGILKKGTRSRFAYKDHSNSIQSEGSLSRVTIVE